MSNERCWRHVQFPYLQSKSIRLFDSHHIVIILVVFSLIMFGMSFAFVFNCVRKLIRDHRIIQVSEFYFLNANCKFSLSLSLCLFFFSVIVNERSENKVSTEIRENFLLHFKYFIRVVPRMFPFVNIYILYYLYKIVGYDWDWLQVLLKIETFQGVSISFYDCAIFQCVCKIYRFLVLWHYFDDVALFLFYFSPKVSFKKW